MSTSYTQEEYDKEVRQINARFAERVAHFAIQNSSFQSKMMSMRAKLIKSILGLNPESPENLDSVKE